MVKLFEIIGKPITGEWGKNDDVGNGIPVLRTTNFTNEGHINYSKVITRKINTSKIKNKLLRTGDIIIEKSGGGPDQPVGRVVYFEGEPNKYLSNNFTSILRITDKATCNAKYLFYQLWWYHKTGKTNSYQNKTTGISNLKLDKYVRELDIRLPSILSQNMIVKTLDSVLELLALRKQQLAELDNLIKSTFYDMFGDPVVNDKGWEIKSLGHLLEDIRYGTSTPPRFSDSGYCFVRATNIKSGRIIDTEMKFISENEAERISKCRLQDGDLIIVRSGVNSGDTCVIDEIFAGQFAGYDLIITPNKALLNSIYLNELINTNYMSQVVKPLTRRAAQPHLNAEQVKNLPIVLPIVDLQNKFAIKVKRIEEQKYIVKKAIEETQYLFDSLMSEYFD
jgi:type I restriction enzyme S subunit